MQRCGAPFPGIQLLGWQGLEETGRVDLPFEPAGPALRGHGRQRHEARTGLAGLGQDDFLTCVGLLQQARQMGLRFVDADGDDRAGS